MEEYGYVKFRVARSRIVTTFAYNFLSTIYFLIPIFHERAGDQEDYILRKAFAKRSGASKSDSRLVAGLKPKGLFS
jgi:hypothetical protein